MAAGSKVEANNFELIKDKLQKTASVILHNCCHRCIIYIKLYTACGHSSCLWEAE